MLAGPASHPSSFPLTTSPFMASVRTENKWTPEEDDVLRVAVEKYGRKNSWQKISSCLPGRTNKSCRKRWVHSLDPTLKKGRWTAAEDEKLLEAVALHGKYWWQVARHIEGRTDDQCAKRWREKLDPNIRKAPWTREEDETLLGACEVHGKKWNVISKMLPGRPAVHCRNRYQSLQRTMSTAGASTSTGASLRPPSAGSSESSYGESANHSPSLVSHEMNASGVSFTPRGVMNPPDGGSSLTGFTENQPQLAYDTARFLPRSPMPSSPEYSDPRNLLGYVPNISTPSSHDSDSPRTPSSDIPPRLSSRGRPSSGQWVGAGMSYASADGSEFLHQHPSQHPAYMGSNGISSGASGLSTPYLEQPSTMSRYGAHGGIYTPPTAQYPYYGQRSPSAHQLSSSTPSFSTLNRLTGFNANRTAPSEASLLSHELSPLPVNAAMRDSMSSNYLAVGDESSVTYGSSAPPPLYGSQSGVNDWSAPQWQS